MENKARRNKTTRTALRVEAPKAVAYCWVVSTISREPVGLYCKPLDPQADPDDIVEDVVLAASVDWEMDGKEFALGDHGVDQIQSLLRGQNLQDALRQLKRQDVAFINTEEPKMREIPERKLVQPKTAAVDYGTEGLLDELLGVLTNVNDIIQHLGEMEQGIHEAKAEGDTVAAEANEVIMVAKTVSGHLEAARGVLLERLDMFLGGGEKPAKEE